MENKKTSVWDIIKIILAFIVITFCVMRSCSKQAKQIEYDEHHEPEGKGFTY